MVLKHSEIYSIKMLFPTRVLFWQEPNAYFICNFSYNYYVLIIIVTINLNLFFF